MGAYTVPADKAISIVDRICARDPSGETELYEFLQRGMWYFLVRKLGVVDAQDALHDVFSAVIDGIRKGGLASPKCLPGFVRTIAVRTVAQIIAEKVAERQRTAI